jgi:hypothetical protein
VEHFKECLTDVEYLLMEFDLIILKQLEVCRVLNSASHVGKRGCNHVVKLESCRVVFVYEVVVCIVLQELDQSCDVLNK